MPHRFSIGEGSGCFRHEGVDVSCSCCCSKWCRFRCCSSLGMVDRSAVVVVARRDASEGVDILEPGFGSRGGSTYDPVGSIAARSRAARGSMKRAAGPSSRPSGRRRRRPGRRDGGGGVIEAAGVAVVDAASDNDRGVHGAGAGRRQLNAMDLNGRGGGLMRG